MTTQSCYSAGVASIDVTPPVGTYLAGYDAREPSTDVYQELRASVLVLSDGPTTLALVTIDWLGFYDHAPAVKDRVASALDIPPDHIFLSASHTHCGPILRELDVARHGAHLDPAYMESVFTRLADAARQANEAAVPVTLTVGTGWCGFSASRRKPMPDGTVSWQPSLDAPHDHQVPTLVLTKNDASPLAILFGYACHPTAAGALRSIGGAYPGFATRAIEEHYPGATAMFIQGCGGDQKPFVANPETGDFRQASILELEKLGDQLAASTAHLIDHGDLATIHGPLSITSRELLLTCEPATQDALARLRSIDNAHVRTWVEHYEHLLQEQTEIQTTVPLELQTVTFGADLALLGLAAEASAGYGIRARNEFGNIYDLVWTAGYTNAIIGYLPTRGQIPRGGYEVLTNQQILLRSGPLQEDTEERIFHALGEMIGQRSG